MRNYRHHGEQRWHVSMSAFANIELNALRSDMGPNVDAAQRIVKLAQPHI